MGCDIHLKAERRMLGVWTEVAITVFDWRSYGMFGFLADVRNYSFVPPISEQRGLPEDYVGEQDDLGDHSYSWLTVEELANFDYDKEFEDRRTFEQIAPNILAGNADTGPGNGVVKTFRAFLGEEFFQDLEALKCSGAERIVFGFDS